MKGGSQDENPSLPIFKGDAKMMEAFDYEKAIPRLLHVYTTVVELAGKRG